MAVPKDKLSLDGLETKWDPIWDRSNTYRFDRSKTRAEVFSIDTPPPTVSGSLHLGTVFGYVQTDAIARFQRMNGREVFYPMGWDDNGLPTERRVQQHYGVRCDPSMPYEPNGNFTESSGKDQRPISRRNFVELCHRLTAIDEREFEKIFRRVGLSVDWSLTYATIDDHCRKVAQRAFLRNVRRGEAYAAESPTLWDVDFQTAVAQAELEEREIPGAYHRLAFARPDGEPVMVETTRPELLPACVALVAHPDDERYRSLFGSEVITPLFGVRVPVLAHPLASMEKGTGIAMVCTFGDTTDIVWWRELGLPVRSVMQRDGRFQTKTPDWLGERGADAWGELAGRTTNAARRRIVELLRTSGGLIGDPRSIVHPVKFFEKGERPLEIVTSRQWYLRNGTHDARLKEQMLERGRTLNWHPGHMRVRYEHWVEGLNTDWLISRQRYFGVPFPVWYRLDEAGEPQWDEPIFCDEEALPVDPQSDPPPGFNESQRGAAGGFTGDPDVLDTWATSSLTPQIVCGWEDDPDLFDSTFPMDLRPQGPEIIRTWLFSTALRSHLEHDALPWRHTTINGWILDPDRKKMSKSKGNVVTPTQLLEQFGADGMRYWACRAAPGTDTAADPKQMKIGRRLANKVLNASRFVLGLGGERILATEIHPSAVTEELDRAVIARLVTVVEQATASFEAYQYHQALDRVESFFWDFCDNYIELVKDRAYSDRKGAESARAALSIVLETILRLFAPFIPFVTEEVWSWWRSGSVHRAGWPNGDELKPAAAGVDPDLLAVAATTLAEVRKAKSTRNQSLRSEVSRLTIGDVPGQIHALRAVQADLCAAGVITELVLQESPERSVTVEMAPVG